MKAVILEIIKGRAVVMKADGSVTKIRNRNYSVGDEIYMKEGVFSHRRWAPILTALLIFAMIGTGTWVYADDYELNALETDGTEFMIKVNRRGKVTSVERDGEEISFENSDIKDFLEELFDKYDIEAIAPMGDSEEDAEKLAEEIRAMIEERREEAEKKAEDAREKAEEARERAQEEKGDDDYDNEGLRAREENMSVKGLSPEDVERARELGITPGKYNIITNLMEVENVDRYLNRIRSEYGIDEDEDTDNKELSKRIMEEFSARNGEKNNPSVNAPGQADKDEKDERDNPSQFAPGQVKKLEANDNDEDAIDDEDEENGESGRPASPGKSNEAPGQNKDKTKNN